MNASVNIGMNNTYDIQLVDSKTGELKQQGTFKNRLIADFNYMMCIPTGSSEAYPYNRAGHPWYMLACGDGDTTPEYANTGLVNELWRVTCGSKTPIQWSDDGKASAVFTYTFPAEPAYVGTIKEVGLRGKYYTSNSSSSFSSIPVTRALLKDSEGQIISFNKTDTDVLIINVTLELTFTSRNENFTFFKYPAITGFILSDKRIDYYLDGDYRYGDQSLEYLDRNVELAGEALQAVYNSEASDPLHKNGTAYDLSGQVFQAYLDTGRGTDMYGLYNTADLKSQKRGYLRYASKRLGTTQFTSETYFKYVVIPGLGYFTLPNESVLPAYKISDIPVGTGDGETTEFLNPLSYFKENTEVVKKNGLALTRDVDYTISNVSNGSRTIVFAQDVRPIKVTGPDISDSAYVKYTSSRKFFATFFSYAAMYHYDVTKELPDTDKGYAFRNGEPLLIEYSEPVTLNYMRLRYVSGIKATSPNTSYTLPSDTMFYIDYSNDGVEYTELGSTGLTGSGSDLHVSTLDFATTTAKYWRVRTSLNADGCYVIATERNDGSRIWASYSQLGYRDPYIALAEAPAEGDVLTMDVDMDLIFKNNNFVVDVETRIDFYYE